MERLIVNEGQGPVPRELTAPVTRVGGGPACDVVLRHPSAQGSSFALERTSHGHHVRLISGQLFRNEEPCTQADLLHNDTLRVGETLVLYKNPAATLRPAGLAAAASPREELAPATFEELAVLEELEPLEELQPLDELQELPSIAGREEPGKLADLEGLEELEELQGLEELQELEELAELPPAEELAPAAPAPPGPGMAADRVAAAEAATRASVSAPAPPAAVTPVGEEPLPDLEDPGELEPLDELELTDFDAPPTPAPAPAPAVPMPAADGTPRAPLRAAEGIRFRRPLPPGRRGPTFLPPAHPGRPSR